MNWLVLVLLTVGVGAGLGGSSGPRRCAGRLARERLKAAEKIRDKRFFLMCCSPTCASPQRRPRPPRPQRPLHTTRRYQPYHKTWFGLKYGTKTN
ncbi:hypothetical protein RR46_00183 [Papilio xuthus]|uniref:Uncharacterized protein n=1 Tax=Papilio xuthus TaxID=66420 RepID=A0A0N1IJ50_PAPXU|nr:hypothetical protein RR46_03625 [Papilio xuthus]KPJ20705.1 hypothetical protein RR46_00183 [Papilio xuthus]